MAASCLCDDTGSMWGVESIQQYQKVSDFFIALAYFSIPLELFYFVSCSTIFPFRWVLLQFGAFIVLCGLTHLVAVWTYGPHSFHIVLALTLLKFLTALISVATAIALLTLIPQMLRLMVREGLLRKKTHDLGQEVVLKKREEEAGWNLRMLTHEIRRSLNRHTILYTTLVELSKILALRNCAVWMPDFAAENQQLVLTHELRGVPDLAAVIPMDDPEVVGVVEGRGVVVLGERSCFRKPGDEGPAAAVAMPMLRVANFKGGTPESMDAEKAVLVLVLDGDGRQEWREHELELVEAVVDQVAVALSHAAVVEDSLRMREKLVEQNSVLERARKEALKASRARGALQNVMGREMAAPARSAAALLAVLQKEKLKPEQLGVVDPMVKLGHLLLTLAADATKEMSSLEENGRLELELKPFFMPSLIKDLVTVSKLLCSCRHLNFDYDVSKELPGYVMGDQNRILQLALFMIGHVLNSGGTGGLFLALRVEEGGQKVWNQGMREEFVQMKMEVRRSEDRDVEKWLGRSRSLLDQNPTLGTCRKLAQLMNGNLSFDQSSESQAKSMNLTVRLDLNRSGVIDRMKYKNRDSGIAFLNRVNILLADNDGLTQSILQRVTNNSGRHLSIAASWFQCIEIIRSSAVEFQLLLIDVHLLEENIHEISSRVRKLKSGGWVMIIALVPYANEQIRHRCLRNGVHGIVAKPVIQKEIEEEIEMIINQSHFAAPLSL